MIRRLKAWVAKALILPIIQRDVALLTQRADTLSTQLIHLETQAAAWQAVLVNEHLKIRSVLGEMDLVLRGIAASPAHSRPAAGGIGDGNSEAISILSEEVRKLRADLIERTRQMSDEQSQ